MPIAKVNGIKLYFEEHGSGYPLVFSHGFAGAAELWQSQVAAFSKRYRFIIYDARGHGQSGSPASVDDYSADIVVEDLRQLMANLGITKAVVGGHSMGGYTSLRFYLRSPEMVAALVLTGTGPGYRDAAHMAQWNAIQEKRAFILKAQGKAALNEKSELWQSVSFIPRDLLMRHDPVGIANMALKVVGQHDTVVFDRLAEVKCPTLVVVGENDTAFLKAADYLARVINGARKVVVPQAGHSAHREQPDVYNKAVLEFLDGLNLKA